MRQLFILEGGDTIEKSDYYRPLLLSTDHYGDVEVNKENIYSGLVENNLKWAPVTRCIEKFWIGKTVDQFIDSFHEGIYRGEFARGDIPPDHIFQG